MTTIINHGKVLESIKNELATRKDFNLSDAFNMFDLKRTGSIDLNELQEGFANFHINISKEEA